MDRVLKPFEYFEPGTVQEAVQLLSSYGNKARVLAGGTDLIVDMKQKGVVPQYIVYINTIPDLEYIQYDDKDGLKIGALVTHAAIADSPVIQEKYGLLSTACNKVGTPQIRYMGTIGGNLCKAGPSQDTPPVLLALEAKLKLVGRDGERIVPIDKFFIAPFQTSRNEAELLTEIQIPPLPRRSAACYQWSTKITKVDETLVGVAVFMSSDSAGGVCNEVRIGLCSIAPTPMRAKRAEELLRGKRIQQKLVEEAAQVAADEVNPRSRPDYRRLMTGILVKQAINEVWQRIK